MTVQRIPLAGSIVNRNSNPESFINEGQRFTNCYPEVTQNPVTGQSSLALYKRLGYTGTNNAPASYAGLGGAFVWSGGNRAVFPYLNGTTLAVYDSNLAIVGATITNVSGWPLITETTYNNKATLTMTLRKSTDSLQHAYYFSEGDVSWTEITDTDYPVNQGTPLTTVGRIVHLDGFAFIIDTKGQIWNSNLNDITTWTATGFITAQSSPDSGAGLAVTKNIVVAFGSGSIEFFQNAGNATGSPLTRIASAAINIGSTTVGTGFNPSHIEIGDSVYFFGTGSDSGQTGVYRLTGTSLQKISNPAIDKLILENVSSDVYGWAGTFKSHGMTHLLMYTGGTGNAPCYCLETGVWWYFTCGDTNTIRSCVDLGTKSYLTGGTRKLYTMDSGSPVFTDDGSTMTMSIQTQNIDHGTRNRKFYKSAEIIGDIRSTAGNTTISYSDDDYQSFSTARNVDMSSDPPARPKLYRLGSGRRRAWKVEDTVDAPFRAEALEIEFDVGSL